jgi:hypothetical protein
MRTRDEHLEWCKARAREYFDAGDLVNAVTSMGSDLEKHPETTIAHRPALQGLIILGGMYAMSGDAEAVHRWIEGWR